MDERLTGMPSLQPVVRTGSRWWSPFVSRPEPLLALTGIATEVRSDRIVEQRPGTELTPPL